MWPGNITRTGAGSSDLADTTSSSFARKPVAQVPTRSWAELPKRVPHEHRSRKRKHRPTLSIAHSGKFQRALRVWGVSCCRLRPHDAQESRAGIVREAARRLVLLWRRLWRWSRLHGPIWNPTQKTNSDARARTTAHVVSSRGVLSLEVRGRRPISLNLAPVRPPAHSSGGGSVDHISMSDAMRPLGLESGCGSVDHISI